MRFGFFVMLLYYFLLLSTTYAIANRPTMANTASKPGTGSVGVGVAGTGVAVGATVGAAVGAAVGVAVGVGAAAPG